MATAAAAVDEVNADIALPLVFEASTTKRTGGGVDGDAVSIGIDVGHWGGGGEVVIRSA